MLTYEDIRNHPVVRTLIEAGNQALAERGFTDHGHAHAGITAKMAGDLLEQLGYGERECELARMAGYMHDIGNAVNRDNHAVSGALLAYGILRGENMAPDEAAAVMTAIGHHDEKTAAPVTPISAALILADKSDVRRSRVRQDLARADYDMHDRVNFAVIDSALTLEGDILSLRLHIDTEICAVIDYFEIFLGRMTLCRDAAAFLGKTFALTINETRML